MANPNTEHLQYFFNLQNKKFIKSLYKLNIANIHLKKILYVPMLLPLVTLEETEKYEIGKEIEFAFD